MRWLPIFLAVAAFAQTPDQTNPPGPPSVPSNPNLIWYTPPFTNAVSESQAAYNAQRVSVKDFGAKGDAETMHTDDAPAFQRAINSGASTVWIPDGSYLLKEPLDLTNRLNNPVHLVGAGKSRFGYKTSVGGTQGTVLVGDTGGFILDLTGSNDIQVSDMLLCASTQCTNYTYTQQSPNGILMARSNNVATGENHLTNVHVFLDHTGTGVSGTVSIYCVDCESSHLDHVSAVGDAPLVIAATNVLSKTSPFQTITGPASMTSLFVPYFEGQSWSDAGLQIYTSQNIEGFFYLQNICPVGTCGSYPNGFAIRLQGSTNALRISGQIEEYSTALFAATGTTHKNLVFTPFVVSANLGHITLQQNVTLEAPYISISKYSGPSTLPLFAVTSGTGNAINGGILNLQADQTIAASPAIAANNVEVIAAAVPPSVTFAAGSTYLLNGNPVAAATTLTGTSGTASCSQSLQGTLKVATCYLNGYAETGTAQTYSFPAAFSTSPVLQESGGTCGTYNPTSTASVLTLPANAAMTAETCNIVVMGQ